MFCLLNKNNPNVKKYEPYILHTSEDNVYLPRNIQKQLYNKDILEYTDKNFKAVEIEKYKFTSELRAEQIGITDKLLEEYNTVGSINGIVHARPGVGKCQGKNTPIIMYDGSVKLIQDITNGEFLMGPDSQPRIVDGVTEGYGDMYKVTPIKGEPFTCNADHVLSLKSSYTDNKLYPFDSITNISIKDYLKMNRKFKDKMKLWRVGIDFTSKIVKFDPYIIGAYIGDGTKKTSSMTIANDSFEILNYFKDWMSCNNLKFGYIDKRDNHCTYNIISDNDNINEFRTYILNECVTNNNERKIPKEYLINTKNVRLDLLAGLLDTDGYYHNGCYEIICKDEIFADQICFISRSLGLACYKKEKIGTIKKLNFKGTYYQCLISGNVDIIPCKVKRKKAKKRKQIKNILKTGLKIEYIGKDNYYGFSLDKDHLYVMGDFTVTHNTVMSIWLSAHLNKKTLIIIDTIKIAEQWKEEILRHTDLTEDDIGLIKGKIFDVENKRFIITTPQTLASKVKTSIKEFYKMIRDIGIDLIFFDECHKMGVKHASSSLLFNTKNVIGLSATPYFDREKNILVKSIFDDILVTYGTYDYQPIMNFTKFSSGLGEKYGKRISYLWNSNFIQARSIYNSKLHESKEWIDTIYNIVKRETEQNNKIIIICLTKKQLNFVYDHLKDRNIQSAKLYSEKNDIDKINDNVIVATYKYASHAFDYAALSRLILATPIMGRKSLIQTIGRIVRKSNNKKDAIVYDLIDEDNCFNNIFIKSIKIKINILKTEFENCIFKNI